MSNWSCYITVDFAMAASHNSTNMKFYDLVSQLLFDRSQNFYFFHVLIIMVIMVFLYRENL